MLTGSLSDMNTDGDSLNYAYITSDTIIVPEIVFDITTGHNAEGKPTLKWADVEGAASYEVYRSTAVDGDFVKTFTTKGTTYTNTSAVAGTTYYYKVRVILTNGDDVYSEAVSNDCIIPGVVFDITTGHNDAGKPTLKWANITGAASYEVYRSDAADGDFVKVFSTKGTTYTNSSATAGKTYYYKVKVILTDGEEVYSEVMSNICLALDEEFDITIGNNAAGKPILQWNVIKNAVSYEVHRSKTVDGDYVKVFTTEGTSYTHVSATAGNSYYYQLKAVLSNGTEVLSDVVTNTCL